MDALDDVHTPTVGNAHALGKGNFGLGLPVFAATHNMGPMQRGVSVWFWTLRGAREPPNFTALLAGPTRASANSPASGEEERAFAESSPRREQGRQ